MAVPEAQKGCVCDPNCPKTLREDSRWKYAGHAQCRQAKRDLKRTHKPDQGRSAICDAQKAYEASIGSTKTETVYVESEIERLQALVVEAEVTALAAGKAYSECTDRLELVTVIVKAFDDIEHAA
jgi:hypothetical protein